MRPQHLHTACRHTDLTCSLVYVYVCLSVSGWAHSYSSANTAVPTEIQFSGGVGSRLTWTQLDWSRSNMDWAKLRRYTWWPVVPGNCFHWSTLHTAHLPDTAVGHHRGRWTSPFCYCQVWQDMWSIFRLIYVWSSDQLCGLLPKIPWTLVIIKLEKQKCSAYMFVYIIPVCCTMLTLHLELQHSLNLLSPWQHLLPLFCCESLSHAPQHSLFASFHHAIRYCIMLHQTQSNSN